MFITPFQNFDCNHCNVTSNKGSFDALTQCFKNSKSHWIKCAWYFPNWTAENPFCLWLFPCSQPCKEAASSPILCSQMLQHSEIFRHKRNGTAEEKIPVSCHRLERWLQRVLMLCRKAHFHMSPAALWKLQRDVCLAAF